MPNPERQFIVEVVALEVEVGAVLFYCLFDVVNGGLLAVKLALDEWRHWLQGAQQPFNVWTDH